MPNSNPEPKANHNLAVTLTRKQKCLQTPFYPHKGSCSPQRYVNMYTQTHQEAGGRQASKRTAATTTTSWKGENMRETLNVDALQSHCKIKTVCVSPFTRPYIRQASFCLSTFIEDVIKLWICCSECLSKFLWLLHSMRC